MTILNTLNHKKSPFIVNVSVLFLSLQEKKRKDSRKGD